MMLFNIQMFFINIKENFSETPPCIFLAALSALRLKAKLALKAKLL